MQRDAALARLKSYEPVLRKAGLTGLYLFGSTARGEAVQSSDIDLLFEYDRQSDFSLFDQARLALDLTEEIGTPIQLVSRYGLRPRVKARVEADMVQIF
jgi:uncharacterized protein